MDSGMGLVDISKRLSTCGWKIEGTLATSVFRKLSENSNTLCRYTLDFIYKNATYELWKDGQRVTQKKLDYDKILENALENKV